MVILFGKHIVLVLSVNVKCMLNHRMSRMLTVALVLLAEIVTFLLVHWSICLSFLVSVNPAIIKVTGNDVHAKIWCSHYFRFILIWMWPKECQCGWVDKFVIILSIAAILSHWVKFKFTDRLQTWAVSLITLTG